MKDVVMNLNQPIFARWQIKTAFAVWMAALVTGYLTLTGFSSTPGQSAEAIQQWAGSSVIASSVGKPLLIVAIHPKCMCSAATVTELEQVLLRCNGRVDVHALVLVPQASDESFKDSAVISRLQKLPSVAVHFDLGGNELRRLGLHTSGNVLLYSSTGQLLYNGGITYARGHEGDNLGESQVEDAILKGQAPQTDRPVFGCKL